MKQLINLYQKIQRLKSIIIYKEINLFKNKIQITEQDLITGEKIAHACDSIFFHYEYINRNPARNGQRVIYTDTYRIEEVVRTLPTNKCFILVAHNSDRDVDDGLVASLPSNVIKLFSQNVRASSNKVVSLPIGLENERWFPHLKKKQKIVQNSYNSTIPSKLVYVNHANWTNPSVRVPVYNYFKNKHWATCIDNQGNGARFNEYVSSILDHFYVVSPNGNGCDCHRTWEILYLNRVPIVTRNGKQFEKMFEGLPVLIVDSWEQVTEELLLSKMDYFKNTEFNGFEKLKVDYWINLIKNDTLKYNSVGDNVSQEQEHARLAQMSKHAIVEIGVLFGDAAFILASNNKDVNVYGIDPIIPDSMNQSLIGSLERIKLKTNSFSNFKFINDFSYNVAKGWREPIGYLFIDGDHTYHAVKKDFEDWFPFVVSGGYISIHDSAYDRGGPIHWPEPSVLARELLNDDRLEYVKTVYSMTVFRKK